MTKELRFSAPPSTQGPTKTLEVRIEPGGSSSVGGANDPIGVEIDLPLATLSASLRSAIQHDLLDDEQPQVPQHIPLTHANGQWSVTVRETGNPLTASLFLTNNRDATDQTIRPEDRGLLAPDQPLVMTIPLQAPTERTQLHVIYRYATEFARRDIIDPTVEGYLDVWLLPSGDAPPATVPVVALFSDQESPTALEMGREVKISWEIQAGIQAKLLGPLSGGHNVLSLDNASAFPMDKGHIRVRAVGIQTYLLQALVKGGKGQPNVQVVRTLTLDVFSPDKFGMIETVPASVLPFGRVHAHWAAWGVNKVVIRVKDRSSRTLLRWSDNPNEGQGVHPFRAGKRENLPVQLTLTLPDRNPIRVTDTVLVVNWYTAIETLPGSELTAGLAYAGNENEGRLLRCAGKEVWLADVGSYDEDDNYIPRFKSLATSSQHTWVCAVGRGDQFLLLGRLPTGLLELFRLDLKGATKGSPISLPSVFQAFGSSQNASLQICALATRIYISATFKGELHHNEAWSMNSTGSITWREEPLLRAFSHCQLVRLGQRIYAFDHDTGQMVRFMEGESGDLGGSLAPPMMAASAPMDPEVHRCAKSKLVAADDILVLLGCGTGVSPQDQVYNPQTNAWSTCGHGLDLNQSQIAFRGESDSPRMWATVGNSLHTLSVGDQTLFSPDFLKGNPDHPLTEPFFDGIAKFSVKNQDHFQEQLVGDYWYAQGLTPHAMSQPALMLRASAPSMFSSWEFQFHFRSGIVTELHQFWDIDAKAESLPMQWHIRADSAGKVANKGLGARLITLEKDADGQLGIHPVMGWRAPYWNATTVTLKDLGNAYRLWLYNASGVGVQIQSDAFTQVLAPHQHHHLTVAQTRYISSALPDPLLRFGPVNTTLDNNSPHISFSGRRSEIFYLSFFAKSREIRPAPITRVNGAVNFAGVATGIHALPEVANYLCAFGDFPAIDSDPRDNRNPNDHGYGLAHVMLRWQHRNANASRLTITANSETGPGDYKGVELAFFFKHYPDPNQAKQDQQYVTLRFMGESLPTFERGGSFLPKDWQKKKDPKTGATFFESPPLALIDEDGHGKSRVTYIDMKLKRMTLQLTPFRVVEDRTYIGPPFTHNHPR